MAHIHTKGNYMILTEIVDLVLHPQNISYFKSKGYELPYRKDNRGRVRIERGTSIKVKVSDLPTFSNAIITAKCEYCGEERKIPYSTLSMNENSWFIRTKETPCIKCYLSKCQVGKNNAHFKHGNQRYSEYQCRSKSLNREFNLTIEQFEEITNRPCHYCGGNSIDRNKDSRGNGIDRKNSEIGYTLENCVPCCATCNFIKNNMPYDEYIRFIKQSYEHLMRSNPSILQVNTQ
jgi:hypothetical protein